MSEIFTTREFAIPQTLLFEVFANPTHLARWWGPVGFSNTIHQFDFQPGGKWELIMQGPDGAEYHNESVFNEIESPSQIVFRHLGQQHPYEMTMTFDELGPTRSRLSWKMVSPGENEAFDQFIRKANEENFDRLESYLANLG
jgi:uncharacterized protein YndB with AHSA1/START domain